MILKNTIFSLLLLTVLSANAINSSITVTTAYEDLTQASHETFDYTFYYTFAQNSGEKINLSSFVKVNASFPQPKIKYDRTMLFGEWIRPKKGSCLNTRGIVLKRDSKSMVSVNDRCVVTNGDWNDPYTNSNFNDAENIQIDHVVALKNAYMTGAHAWTKEKRCLYANYLGNRFHLLAVSGSENMSKSDKSPYEYMPPNKTFVCEYLRNWLEIKYIWKLRLTPREVDAIKTELKTNHCTASDVTVSGAEIKAQRKFMEDNKNLCR